MKNRFLPVLLAAALLLALCACTPKESVAPPVTPSASPTTTVEVTPAFTPAVLDGDYPEYLPEQAQNAIDEDIANLSISQSDGVIFSGSEILSLDLQHSFVAYETYTDLWWLHYRIIPEDMGKVTLYNRSTDGKGGILGDCLIVVQISPDRKYCEQYYGSIPNDGSLDWSDEGACQKKATEIATGISNLEFSLRRDGFPNYSGLGGSDIHFMRGDYTEEKLPWTDCLYIEGDYWQQTTWKNLTAVSLVSPSRERKYLYSIDTTLPDVKAYRGIGLGATHEEVMSAYPEIVPENWPREQWGDQLVYESIPGYIAGDFLHFYFGKEGTVNRIMIELIID